MQRCYYHPKIEAIGQCAGCKLLVCFHCIEDNLCPECAKLKRFVLRGYSGAEPPKLVEPPQPKRSITMELMIERLQKQVFGESRPSARPEASLKLPGKLIDSEAPAGARRSGKRSLRRRAAVKTRQPMAYGFLMPSVAPLVKVSRSPISRMAVLMLVAFSLGAFFARQNSVSATVPPAETPIVEEVDLELNEETLAPRAVEVHYKPVYIHVPVRQNQALPVTARAAVPVPPAAAPAAPAPAPAQAVPAAKAPATETPAAIVAKPMSYPIASRQKFAPVAEPAATASVAAAEPARLDLAYPHPGNILRATPVIRVRVINPGKLALVNLALDGTPIKAVPEISDLIEVPFDSTAYKNGEHTLQILAMEVDGKVISSQTIPVTIRN